MRRWLPLFLLSGVAICPPRASAAEAARTVTVSEGTDMAATVSPDRTTIVLELQGSLWALPFRGGAARQLTDPLLEPARPHYSPQGDAIAFQAYQGGTFHIWTMRPDGSAVRQVTFGPGDDRDPRFSPDGTRIAFSSDRAFKGNYDIWVVDLASGDLSQWTSSPADEYEPAWSPDGAEIAFVSGAGANGRSILALRQPLGAPRTVITAPVGSYVNSPAWGPDGRKIAYVMFADATSHLMVSGARAGSGDDVFPFYPEWLPGNRLLYTGDGKIQVASLDGGRTEPIPFQATFTLNRPPYRHKSFDLDSNTPRQVKGIVGPSLSPDGKRVVFEALNQLWIMEIGSKPEAITQDAYYKTDPAWSPDGRRLAYSSDKSGTENIYIRDLATGEERRPLPASDFAEVSSAWSPDGRRLAFHDQEGGTYILEIETGAKKLVIPNQFAPSKPNWSANGKTVAIAALKPYTHRFREGASQILTVDLATGVRKYTEVAPSKSIGTRGEDGPLYSPDGTAVAFVMDSLLWIRPVDANGVPTAEGRPINGEVTDAPTWSGDSRELLYLSNGKLRLISRDGSNPRTVPCDLAWAYQKAPARTVIHAGRLWDGRGPDVQTDVDIVVADHRIESIAPHRQRGAETDASTRWVDASKLTVMPGLWETHTHHWVDGRFFGDRLGRLWLAYGVTTLESQGDPAYRAVETRESFGSGARVGPRFFATGEALDGGRIYYSFMRPITSEAQLRRELSRARALDYDLLKTYVRLPHAMQKEVIAFAHDQLGVIVDSHYLSPGVLYGEDGTSHLSATDRLGYAYSRSALGASYGDATGLYEAAGMFVISTLRNAFLLYGEDPSMVDDRRLVLLNPPWYEARLRSERGMAMNEKPGERGGKRDPAFVFDVMRREEQTMAALRRGGVLTLAGTDSPMRDVATELHLNLRAKVKFGLAPWQSLQTATSMAARAYGVGRDLGTVEPGKLADLALVAGDPLVNISDAANVRYVMRNGILYSVAELMAPFAHPQPGLK